jgi:glutathione S-transferase
MVLQIYLDPCTVNSRKVLAGLDLMKLDYEYNYINYFTGEHKSADFVKINPHATVPAAVDGDLKLTESNSILMYAADISGDDTTYPKDLKLRADANRWLLWEASVWFGTNYVYLVEYVVKPLLGAQPDESVIEAEAPKWNKAAGILDTRLGETGKWILPGNNPTIVDMAVASAIHLHEAQRLPLAQHKNLTRWIANVEALPSWQKTQGAVDKALLPNKAGSKEVRASFNYTKDLGDKLTELYFYEDPKAVGIHEPGDDPTEVAVHDGWDRAKDFSVDKEGFAVKDFKSSFSKADFEDDARVREKFYPEVVEFLKKELGAKRVLVFDHTIRTKANQAKPLTDQKNTSQRAPVALVHCDYTAESGPKRVQQLLPDEADALLARRTAFINVWKPLNKVEEYPLAMCDVTSSPPDDFFKLYLRYHDRTGENYVMRANEKHNWVYFPDMTPDQSILLKTYDSDKSRAQFVGHSAFVDPTSKPDAPARESCEIRTICFF